MHSQGEIKTWFILYFLFQNWNKIKNRIKMVFLKQISRSVCNNRSGVPRTHHQKRRNPHGPEESRCSRRLATAKESQGASIFPWILQLLSTIHPRIQRFGQTPHIAYREDGMALGRCPTGFL